MTESPRLSSEELRELLEGRHLAIISTNGSDGVPHSTPVWFMPEDDGAISMIVDEGAVKLRNLRRDPRASVTIAPETMPYRYARFRGRAELLTEGVEDYPLRMAQRYLGERRGREWLGDPAAHPPFVVVRLKDAHPDTWKDPTGEA
ncbi:MAG: PPOX class F420-dependent oxidoreductase [Chloroflexota bacterium]